MYGRFSGDRHVAWSVVNEMSFVSVAVYSFTGMFTSPNEIAPLQIARADGMGQRPPGGANAWASYRASPAGVSEEGVRGAVAALGPRRDLERLRWARGLARHAVDAVRLADGLGLVRPPRAGLVGALVRDLCGPCPPAG